jgi:hypothetical protein
MLESMLWAALWAALSTATELIVGDICRICTGLVAWRIGWYLGGLWANRSRHARAVVYVFVRLPNGDPAVAIPLR